MSNETKHTPGPWKQGFYDGSGPTYIVAGEAGDGAVVVSGCADSHGILQGVRNEADARLIAAAPDLLAACEAMTRDLPELWGDEVRNGQITLTLDESVVDAILAAIAKAKGERE